MVIRDSYIEKLKNVMWEVTIKIITGLSRSGKSTLLFELFAKYLTSNGVKDENIMNYLAIELPSSSAFKIPN